MPNVRTLLVSQLTLYVSRSGNDSSDGLSWSTAKATGQGAINELAANYDTGLTVPVIQFSAEEHNAGMSLRNVPGAGTVIIRGDVNDPRNVPLFVSNNFPVNYPGGACVYLIEGFYIKALTPGYGSIRASELGRVKFSAIDFGETGHSHVMALRGAQNMCNGPYTISGGGLNHFYSEEAGLVHAPSQTITIENEPLFTQAFARATNRSHIQVPALQFNGAVDSAGWQYKIEEQSFIGTNNAGNGYFPGGPNYYCSSDSVYA